MINQNLNWNSTVFFDADERIKDEGTSIQVEIAGPNGMKAINGIGKIIGHGGSRISITDDSQDIAAIIREAIKSYGSDQIRISSQSIKKAIGGIIRIGEIDAIGTITPSARSSNFGTSQKENIDAPTATAAVHPIGAGN